MSQHKKLAALQNMLKLTGGIAIAFSGGTDSTFLLKAAHDILGNKVMVITASSSVFSAREFKAAADFAEHLGIRHKVFFADQLEVEGFADNPLNRCYLCKRALFRKIVDIASENNISLVADGSHVDDNSDYRPGIKALKELGIRSPLQEAGMTKEDIRLLSKEWRLPTWDKPPFACLASRVPYGHKITREKLAMIEKAEQYLFDWGFRQVRVRHHGDIARIEVSSEERSRFADEELMDRVDAQFSEVGFAYTALDLKGYRTGSMNEIINNDLLEGKNE